MAKRPSWSGFLKLSLVTCPVQMYSVEARQTSVSFHLINPKTRNRIKMKPIDPETGEPLERKDLVRGYELEDGRYVTVTDEELAEIRLKSTKTIEIEKFVDFAEIDPLYVDQPYYLLPDGEMAVEAYGVIREAMRKEKKAALGRLVMSYRERVVAIQPRGKGLLLNRLKDAREIDARDFFGEIKQVKADPRMVEIATKIIEQNEGKFEPRTFEDPYESALRDMIKRREKGAEPLHIPEPEEEPTNVVNLMDALKKSLRSAGGRAAEGSSEGGRKVVSLRKPERKPARAHKSKKAPAKRRA